MWDGGGGMPVSPSEEADADVGEIGFPAWVTLRNECGPVPTVALIAGDVIFPCVVIQKVMYDGWRQGYGVNRRGQQPPEDTWHTGTVG